MNKKEEYCDLHLHSNYSDGTFSPSEVVEMAARIGLSVIALSDHNTVKGLPEFTSEAEKHGIEAIRGIEFSVDYHGKELHLLALCVSEKYYNDIEKMMEHYLLIREQTNREMIASLRAAGYMIDYDTIYKKSGKGYINRAHIAAELTEKGYTPSIRAAFDTLLRKDGPYFRPRVYPDVFEIIEYIQSIGAVSILAHPFLQFDEEGLRVFLAEAKKHGLCGMETIYTEFNEEQIMLAKALAEEFDLLESGGSDFHGATKPGVALGVGFGNLKIPASFAYRIKDKAEERFCRI